MTNPISPSEAALWCLIGCDNIPANTTGDPARFVDFCIRGLQKLGIDMALPRLLETGERIYNLTRLFNIREGFSGKDDRLPPRLTEVREDTGWSIAKEDFDRMLNEYYQLRGWDAEGTRRRNTLRSPFPCPWGNPWTQSCAAIRGSCPEGSRASFPRPRR